MNTFLANSSRTIFIMVLVVSVLSCDGREYSGEGKKQRVVLPAGETHEGWYFAAGDQVIIEGTVNGDAYVAAGSVQVDGTINGDLIVAGGQVVIGGKVSDDVRVVGGSVECSGVVGKNVAVAGGNVRIAKSSEIGGGLLAAGGAVFIAGTVTREAMVGAGDMSVSGTINGNTNFAGGNLSVLSGASIGGNLRALVEDKDRAEIAVGTVRGTVNIGTRETKPAHTLAGFQPWRFWLKILWALSLVATALVLILLLPKQAAGIGETILRKPGKSILWGVAGLVIVPVVMIILFITVIGVPLGLLLLVLYLWILYLSQLSLGVALGQRLLGGGGPWKLIGACAVGILLVQVLTFIPYVRTIVVIAGLLFGFGAIVLVVKDEFESRRTMPQ